MRKLLLFLFVLCACVSINAQTSVDDYIGTWRGENYPTLRQRTGFSIGVNL